MGTGSYFRLQSASTVTLARSSRRHDCATKIGFGDILLRREPRPLVVNSPVSLAFGAADRATG
jgi:hypothetical protein